MLPEKESDPTKPADDSPSPSTQSETKPSVSEPLKRQPRAEVFTFNKPFLVQNQSVQDRPTKAEKGEPSGVKPPIPGIKRGSREDQLQSQTEVEELLNRPPFLDDEILS